MKRLRTIIQMNQIKFIGILPYLVTKSYKGNFISTTLKHRKELLFTYQPKAIVKDRYYCWYFERPDDKNVFMCTSQKQFQEIVLQLELGIPIEEIIHD